ncbi:8654_t:CDS:2, partial [Diversispora eburnea]
MKERSVVTSFLTYSKEFENDPLTQGDKILLLKRSDKVHTFQHLWAGVSGGMEPQDETPLDRAITEIQEEIKLTTSDINLIRSGLPLTIRSEETSTIWKVYPFLFRLNSKDIINKVKIDWEHDTFKWIKPEDMKSFNTVPHLLETFHRVYLPKSAHNGLLYMLKNRSSGAQELAEKALDIFVEVIKDKSCRQFTTNFKELYLAWLNIGWHLSEIRPTMKASITFAILKVMKQIKDHVINSLSDSLDSVDLDSFEKYSLDIIEQFKITSKEAEQKINSTFMSTLLSDTKVTSLHIMTISYSSTIFSALSQLIIKNVTSDHPYNLIITILESRPLNEGATLANKLSHILNKNSTSKTNHYVKIQVITDASCNYFMPTITHVLLGSDIILGNDGSVINKMGSSLLALSAKHHKKQVYVMSRTDKIISSDSSKKCDVMEEKDANEIISNYEKGWDKTITVRNVYFEKVESNLIDGYITNETNETQGLLTIKDIRLLGKKIKSMEIL